MQTDKQIVDELRKASAGLMMISESDYPLTVIQWDGSREINPNFLRSITGESEDCAIEEVPIEQVFADGRFERLTDLLQSHLKDVKAYKVGRINIPVYVVGKSPEGNWLGVATRVVQT
jgi:hypothetical protein